MAFRPFLSDHVGGQNIGEGTLVPNWSDGRTKGSGNNTVVLRNEAKDGCHSLHHSASKVLNSSAVVSSKQLKLFAHRDSWAFFTVENFPVPDLIRSLSTTMVSLSGCGISSW